MKLEEIDMRYWPQLYIDLDRALIECKAGDDNALKLFDEVKELNDLYIVLHCNSERDFYYLGVYKSI